MAAPDTVEGVDKAVPVDVAVWVDMAVPADVGELAAGIAGGKTG